MRKLQVLLFLMSTFLVFSCGSSDNEETGNGVSGVSIVGEWSFDTGSHYGNDGEVQWVEYGYITFNSDGSYMENKKYKDESAIYAEGKWALNGSKLTLRMTYAKFGKEEYKDINEKTSFTVVKLTKNELVLDDGDGLDYFKKK